MLIKIALLLTIFELILAQNLSTSSSNSIDNNAIPPDIYKQFALLREEIEALNKNFEQILTQQNEIKKHFEELKTTYSTPIEVRVQPLRAKEPMDDIMEILRVPKFETRFAEIIESSVTADCSEALRKTSRTNGSYKIKLPDSTLEPFPVYCLDDFENEKKQNDSINGNVTNAWTMIQRRNDGSVDFYRNWTEYQQGFGNTNGEFFIGLDKLYALTQSTPQELWIQIEDFEGVKVWAMYNNFVIGSANESYALTKLGRYIGTAGDALRNNVGFKFTTNDNDNDMKTDGNCAEQLHGGWWYFSCSDSNLNGRYYTNGTQKSRMDGITWSTFHDSYSLKYVHMAIRPA